MSTKNYAEFLKKKAISDICSGFDAVNLNPNLFDFQQPIVRWALKKGRAAIFADTGLGKTLMQSSWAQAIPGKVLIVAPLCVAQQTVDEGSKFGVEIRYCRYQKETSDCRITICNYEMLEHFDASQFTGVVLDESSILKAEDGKTRSMIIEKFKNIPYRLSCTATPSPNDFMELGSQSEFLGVMKYSEMLSMFFTHDGKDTSKWRLKGHGKTKFWEWLSTWAAVIRKPSDLGFDNKGYELPPLKLMECEMPWDRPLANTMRERLQVRRDSVKQRCQYMASLANSSNEPWVIWCNLNDESTALASLIPDAVEVHGSLSMSEKERRIHAFTRGEARVIISKAKICGFGLNWQHCRNVGYFPDDSFEKYYQAVRRCYRFGQTQEVLVWMVYTSAEGSIKVNLERKQAQTDEMNDQMIAHMREFTQREVLGTSIERADYAPIFQPILPDWISQ